MSLKELQFPLQLLYQILLYGIIMRLLKNGLLLPGWIGLDCLLMNIPDLYGTLDQVYVTKLLKT